jgi:hypothetical protein
MVGPNNGAVEALQFRVNGLGTQSTFKQTTAETDASVARSEAAAQTQLLASDVVWADAFQAPAEAVLKDEGIEGLDVPSSVFVTSDDLISTSSLAAIWQRIQGASTAEPERTAWKWISYVKASERPAAVDRDGDDDQGDDQLAFEVGVEDTGERAWIRSRSRFRNSPTLIGQAAVIPIIDPGQTQAVTLKVGALVPFGEQIKVKVDVDPVSGETNTANNTAEYPVIFTL